MFLILQREEPGFRAEQPIHISKHQMEYTQTIKKPGY